MDIEEFFQGLERIFASGKQEEVAVYLRQSLARADSEGDSHAAVTILNEMAGYFRSVSNYAESLRAAKRAVADMLQLGYENTIPYGTTLLNAGTAFRAAGDKVTALEHFTNALGVLGALLPEDDYRLAGLFNNISAIYGETGQFEEARDMLQKAVAIMEKQPDMQSDTAIVQTNLAMMTLQMGEYAEALRLLEKAIALFRAEDKSDRADQRLDPHYAAALAAMGEAQLRMNNPADAVTSYEAALKHLQSAFGENQDYAITCRNCAVACAALGQSEKAGALNAKAAEIMRKLGLTEGALPPQAPPQGA